MTKVPTACEGCNKVFMSRVVHGKPHQRFCSRRCKGKAQPPTKMCIEKAHTPEIDELHRQRMLGESNPMWKGGDSDRERRNSAYKTWRIAVFKRDKFICQHCGYFNGRKKKRRDLNAHHNVRWIDSIELRYEVQNGVTLCVPCHIKEHTDKH